LPKLLQRPPGPVANKPGGPAPPWTGSLVSSYERQLPPIVGIISTRRRQARVETSLPRRVAMPERERFLRSVPFGHSGRNDNHCLVVRTVSARRGRPTGPIDPQRSRPGG
jgi:hypothetical protein